ncbi:PilW family protein [Limnoglobus roseus]|uniref:Prepilin-type cleavage/methylation domain-containing protein n=1 Tax=Limnoglobus roseus TaxID=2598579 RepID=A0A5C1AEI2_9BACT|nr:prepilin-type N-terminal cleavage/methylation domain-containing protein [Limnoglobus roseus]QEL15438.1 prepilin-type cleavage/methylation domain-containing protein [Limnoglobus roseus]
MRLHPTAPFRRPGFTLIEVLVAAGLCMLIMAVLAEAFGAGVSTFSLLKSTGELDGRLKTAQTVLRNDLQLPHLEAETGEPVKVSQLRLDMIGAPDRFARPQPRGFFRIAQEGASTAEGNDPDGIPSTRAVNHILQMAVRLPATRQDRVAIAKMPQNNAGGLSMGEQTRISSVNQFSLTNLDSAATRFASQWYEVSYFLSQQSTGNTVPGAGTGTAQQLFSLHRRVRCLLPKEATPPTVPPIFWRDPVGTMPRIDFTVKNTDPTLGTTGANGMSTRIDATTQSATLNSCVDITNPFNRLGGLTSTRGPTGAVDQVAPLGNGEDIVLSNVLSFEVKASWDDRSGGTTVTNEFPFADLVPVANNTTLAGQRIYDTWSTALAGWDSTTAPAMGQPDNRVPMLIRLKAVQIKIRLYDPKNKLTRQLTLVQDL